MKVRGCPRNKPLSYYGSTACWTVDAWAGAVDSWFVLNAAVWLPDLVREFELTMVLANRIRSLKWMGWYWCQPRIINLHYKMEGSSKNCGKFLLCTHLSHWKIWDQINDYFMNGYPSPNHLSLTMNDYCINQWLWMAMNDYWQLILA